MLMRFSGISRGRGGESLLIVDGSGVGRGWVVKF